MRRYTGASTRLTVSFRVEKARTCSVPTPTRLAWPLWASSRNAGWVARDADAASDDSVTPLMLSGIPDQEGQYRHITGSDGKPSKITAQCTGSSLAAPVPASDAEHWRRIELRRAQSRDRDDKAIWRHQQQQNDMNRSAIALTLGLLLGPALAPGAIAQGVAAGDHRGGGARHRRRCLRLLLSADHDGRDAAGSSPTSSPARSWARAR